MDNGLDVGIMLHDGLVYYHFYPYRARLHRLDDQLPHRAYGSNGLEAATGY